MTDETIVEATLDDLANASMSLRTMLKALPARHRSSFRSLQVQVAQAITRVENNKGDFERAIRDRNAASDEVTR